MPTFVMMTKLSPDALGDPEGRRKTGKEWIAKVAKACPDVRWIAHYALLGQYDFMDIYEAPDLETAHEVSYLSRSEGAIEAESWHALPYEEYLSVIEKAGSSR